MSYSNNRIESARRRALDLTYNTKIEVFEPSVNYSAGDGYDISYPDFPTAEYESRLDSPTSSSDQQRSGTTSDVDATIHVRDDTGQQWTEFGDSGDAASRVRDIKDGRTYEVQSVTDPHDGRLVLEVEEVKEPS